MTTLYLIRHSVRMKRDNIETYNTNKVSLERIYDYIDKYFDFSVDNIIKELNLQRPIYYELASYGHFGREEYPWEKIKEFI